MDCYFWHDTIFPVMQYCGCSLYLLARLDLLNHRSRTADAYQQNSTVSYLPSQFNSKGAMDGCAKEAKIITTEKSNGSTSLYRASSSLSVGAILLTVALFVRIETVVHDTKMLDSKFTLEIQQIKNALKEDKDTRQAWVKEKIDALSGK